MTAKAIGILVGLVAAFLAGYHFGGLSTKLAAASAEVHREILAGAKRTTDESTVAQEAKTYETATDPALDPISAPVVRLCYQPPAAAVPSAHPAGSGAHEVPAVRAATAPDPVPGPDIGRPSLQVTHNADAQVAGLVHYIEHVCQAKAL